MLLTNLLNNIPHKILQSGETSEISTVTMDSREVQKGTLFICIRGLNVDRHEYIQPAIDAGAAAVLVDENYNTLHQGVTIIQVKNTRQAMAYIAANYYGNPAKKLRLVGVTGTNGKTSVTYFIEEILRKCGKKTGLIGTVGVKANNVELNLPFLTSTTPDPLHFHGILAEMVNCGVTDVVMEVSSHALALHKMEGLTFNIGVFTNLTQDHLDFHGTMENYALAKAQLFAQSKMAVVNADDKYSKIMATHLPEGAIYITYGIENPSDLQAEEIKYHLNGSEFTLLSMPFTLPINGRFNIYNTLAAIGAAEGLGLTMGEINRAVATLNGVPGRIQAVPNDRGVNVLVDYAHSPDGLEKIIPAVKEFTKGKVITLFGCGGDRDTTKRPIMGKIAGELSDHCIITSDNPRTENPFEILKQVESGTKETGTTYEIIENRKEAILKGVKMLQQGDALIIAGKGHEDYQIIGTTKHHFSDYDTALEALSQ